MRLHFQIWFTFRSNLPDFVREAFPDIAAETQGEEMTELERRVQELTNVPVYKVSPFRRLSMFYIVTSVPCILI